MDGETIQKLTVIGQDLKSLINTDTVLDDNEKILDNQDLAFLLKVSFRTLQRYRVNNQLPLFHYRKENLLSGCRYSNFCS